MANYIGRKQEKRGDVVTTIIIEKKGTGFFNVLCEIDGLQKQTVEGAVMVTLFPNQTTTAIAVSDPEIKITFTDYFVKDMSVSMLVKVTTPAVGTLFESTISGFAGQ
jgi:hypothetical protein